MLRPLLTIALALASPLPALAFLPYDASDAGAFDDVTCVEGTYVCHCDGRPLTAIDATEDNSICLAGCSSLGLENWELHCTSRAGTDYTVSGDDIVYGAGAPDEEEKEDPIIPTLNVAIPGLQFSTPTQEGSYTKVSFLAEYVDALYKLLMVVCAVVTVVMIMIGGLQYILSRGNANGVKQAKERIKNAVVGLVLLTSAYSLAYLLDPSTTRFAALRIDSVPREDFVEESEEDTASYGATGTVDSADLTLVAGDHLINQTGADGQISVDALAALNAAADDFYTQSVAYGALKRSVGIRVSSASRTIRRQAELFYDHCIATGGVCEPDTCNPARNSNLFVRAGYAWNMAGSLAGASSTEESRIVSAIVDAGSASVCQHTNNVAVDIWPELYSYGNKQFDVEMMNLMTSIMYKHGMCRIANEPWHFELAAKGSANCGTSSDSSYTTKGVTYSTRACKKWDGKNHCCIDAVDTNAKPATMCN